MRRITVSVFFILVAFVSNDAFAYKYEPLEVRAIAPIAGTPCCAVDIRYRDSGWIYYQGRACPAGDFHAQPCHRDTDALPALDHVLLDPAAYFFVDPVYVAARDGKPVVRSWPIYTAQHERPELLGFQWVRGPNGSEMLARIAHINGSRAEIEVLDAPRYGEADGTVRDKRVWLQTPWHVSLRLIAGDPKCLRDLGSFAKPGDPVFLISGQCVAIDDGIRDALCEDDNAYWTSLLAHVVRDPLAVCSSH